jgi:hypothetical protein
MTRSLPATGLAVVGIVVIGLLVALPAYRAYSTKAQGQDLANKVLSVCAQGGDAAAPLVALHACPLAKQVASSSPAQVQEVAPPVSSNQIQDMIHEEIARQLPKVVSPPPVTGPSFPPGVAGRPGREQYQPRSTEEAAPPPRQFEYPAAQREPDRRYQEQAPEREPPVTVTEQAPPPPVTQTVQAPVPPVVQQAAPAQSGTPLLNGVGGLLNGLGGSL